MTLTSFPQLLSVSLAHQILPNVSGPMNISKNTCCAFVFFLTLGLKLTLQVLRTFSISDHFIVFKLSFNGPPCAVCCVVSCCILNSFVWEYNTISDVLSTYNNSELSTSLINDHRLFILDKICFVFEAILACALTFNGDFCLKPFH